MCFVLPQKSYINYYHCNFLWLLQQQLESWFLFSTSYCLVVWLCCENVQLQNFDSLVSKTNFSLLIFHVYYISSLFIQYILCCSIEVSLNFMFDILFLPQKIVYIHINVITRLVSIWHIGMQLKKKFWLTIDQILKITFLHAIWTFHFFIQFRFKREWISLKYLRSVKEIFAEHVELTE